MVMMKPSESTSSLGSTLIRVESYKEGLTATASFQNFQQYQEDDEDEESTLERVEDGHSMSDA